MACVLDLFQHSPGHGCPWWQESLVLLMWYFLLSFGWETGHLCCTISPPAALQKGADSLHVDHRIPWTLPPLFLFPPTRKVCVKQKIGNKRNLTSLLMERWDKLSRNGSQSIGLLLITKSEGWCCCFQSGFCFPQLFWIKSKIPSRRKHSQLLQLSWQAEDNDSWHVQSPDIAWSHWCHKWPQQEWQRALSHDSEHL